MSQPCAVCHHEASQEIDGSLVASVPLRKLALKYGMSINALSRHKRGHLSPAIVAVRRSRQEQGAETLVDRLEALIASAQGFLDSAGANSAQGLAAIRELRATLELVAKVTGELDERPVVFNVLADPGYLKARTVILVALAPFPDARLAVANGLRRLEPPAEAPA